MLLAVVTIGVTPAPVAAQDGGRTTTTTTTVRSPEKQAAIDRAEACLAELQQRVNFADAARHCLDETDGLDAAEFDWCWWEEGRPRPMPRDVAAVCWYETIQAWVPESERPAQSRERPPAAPPTTLPDDSGVAPSGPPPEPMYVDPADITWPTRTSASDDQGGFPFMYVLLGIIAVLAVIRLYLLVRDQRATRRLAESGSGAGFGATSMLPGTPVPETTAQHDRQQLVTALVDLHDVVPSDALRSEIVLRLAKVGVEPLVPGSGEPFDPTSQRGVHAKKATERGMDGTVASCDRPGWSDRGEVVRPPEVVVHRWSGP